MMCALQSVAAIYWRQIWSRAECNNR